LTAKYSVGRNPTSFRREFCSHQSRPPCRPKWLVPGDLFGGRTILSSKSTYLASPEMGEGQFCVCMGPHDNPTLITLARSVGQETPGGTALHSMSWKSVAARWCSGGRNACCWVPYDITARFKFHHLSFRRSVCKLGFGEFEVAQAQRRTHASHVMLFLRQPVHHHHSILVLNSK